MPLPFTRWGWQPMALSQTLKADQAQQAGTCFEQAEIELAELLTRKKVHSVKDMVMAIAKQIGFVPSGKQPLPGIKILAQALERFYYVKLGANSS